MGRLVIALLLISGIASAATFDNRGVWQALTDKAIVKNQIITFGMIDVSDRLDVLNIMAIASGKDTLELKIDLYGQMSYNLSDSLTAKLVGTVTGIGDTLSICLADTLSGDTKFPYLWGRITGNSDSLMAVNLFLYMNPREINIINMR